MTSCPAQQGVGLGGKGGPRSARALHQAYVKKCSGVGRNQSSRKYQSVSPCREAGRRCHSWTQITFIYYCSQVLTLSHDFSNCLSSDETTASKDGAPSVGEGQTPANAESRPQEKAAAVEEEEGEMAVDDATQSAKPADEGEEGEI